MSRRMVQRDVGVVVPPMPFLAAGSDGCRRRICDDFSGGTVQWREEVSSFEVHVDAGRAEQQLQDVRVPKDGGIVEGGHAEPVGLVDIGGAGGGRRGNEQPGDAVGVDGPAGS